MHTFCNKKQVCSEAQQRAYEKKAGRRAAWLYVGFSGPLVVIESV